MSADAVSPDYAIAKAAIQAAKKEQLKLLFASALVEQDPKRREQLFQRLSELTRGRNG